MDLVKVCREGPSVRIRFADDRDEKKAQQSIDVQVPADAWKTVAKKKQSGVLEWLNNIMFIPEESEHQKSALICIRELIDAEIRKLP
jgi:hypothetical protein